MSIEHDYLEDLGKLLRGQLRSGEHLLDFIGCVESFRRIVVVQRTCSELITEAPDLTAVADRSGEASAQTRNDFLSQQAISGQ